MMRNGTGLQTDIFTDSELTTVVSNFNVIMVTVTEVHEAGHYREIENTSQLQYTTH